MRDFGAWQAIRRLTIRNWTENSSFTKVPQPTLRAHLNVIKWRVGSRQK
jgi:hypothetical protein